MDTTEIIMISKIYHHHHLESSPQAQLLYFNCKSNEVSGKLPVWSPSERYSIQAETGPNHQHFSPSLLPFAHQDTAGTAFQ